MPQPPDQANVGESALIALGGNLPHDDAGGPERTLVRAIEAMNERIGPVTGKSALFQTPCFPAGAGPDYVNAAVRLTTRLGPQELLKALHAIEADFGRLRVQRWGQRTLDLDLLALGARIVPDRLTFELWRDLPLEEQIGRTPDRLILPHPRMQDRAFVLVPLAEVAPDWVHPVSGRSVAEMLAARPAEERAAIRRLG